MSVDSRRSARHVARAMIYTARGIGPAWCRWQCKSIVSKKNAAHIDAEPDQVEIRRWTRPGPCRTEACVVTTGSGWCGNHQAGQAMGRTEQRHRPTQPFHPPPPCTGHLGFNETPGIGRQPVSAVVATRTVQYRGSRPAGSSLTRHTFCGRRYRPGCTANRAVSPRAVCQAGAGDAGPTGPFVWIGGGDVYLTPKSATEVRAVRGAERTEASQSSSPSASTDAGAPPSTQNGTTRGPPRAGVWSVSGAHGRRPPLDLPFGDYLARTERKDQSAPGELPWRRQHADEDANGGGVGAALLRLLFGDQHAERSQRPDWVEVEVYQPAWPISAGHARGSWRLQLFHPRGCTASLGPRPAQPC